MLTLHEYKPAKPLMTMDKIAGAVAEFFGIKRAELVGKRRFANVSHARHITMYLARKLTPLSLEQVGRYLSGRDHTTVLHGVRLITDMLQRDEMTLNRLRMLEDSLTSEKMGVTL
jgi:chromosomal replication initiator protein